MNALTKMYEGLLQSLGLEIDENDLIHLDQEPLTVEYEHQVEGHISGEIYLPTKDVLKRPEDPFEVKFHPLAENMFLGRSPMLNLLRRLVKFKLVSKSMEIAIAIIEMAIEQEHSGMSMEQIEIASALNVKPSDKAYLNRIFKKILEKVNTSFLDIKLEKNVKVEDKSYLRLATINPIILDEILETHETDGWLYDIKPSSNRAQAIPAVLFNLLFPDELTSGSVFEDAPYFHCLIKLYKQHATHLNTLVETIDSDALEPIDLSWYLPSSKLAKMSTLLPSGLCANVGVKIKGEKQAKAQNATEVKVDPYAKLAKSRADRVATRRTIMEEDESPTYPEVQQHARVEPVYNKPVEQAESHVNPLVNALNQYEAHHPTTHLHNYDHLNGTMMVNNPGMQQPQYIPVNQPNQMNYPYPSNQFQQQYVHQGYPNQPYHDEIHVNPSGPEMPFG